VFNLFFNVSTTVGICLLYFEKYRRIFFCTEKLQESQWGEWSSLSACEKRSGVCVQERRRECNNTESGFQDKNCTGYDTEVFDCDCPVGIFVFFEL
jgi:hypothetical protein